MFKIGSQYTRKDVGWIVLPETGRPKGGWDMGYVKINDLGRQFRADTGPLDILALSKDLKEFLVIELKRDRASDETEVLFAVMGGKSLKCFCDVL